jgi:hypothetical protein
MPVSSGVTQGSKVKYIRTLSDCESLQDSLNNFIHYYDTNQLKVNVNKCHFMRFSRKAKHIEFNYSISSNVQLDKKSETRDLGVILFHISPLFVRMPLVY